VQRGVELSLILSLNVDIRNWVTPFEPEIQQLAAELGSPQRIFEFMQQVAYVEGTYLPKPLTVLQKMSGDCDEQAVLLASLLRAIGEDAYVRIAQVENYPVLHAWVVWYDGAYRVWRNLDPSGTVFFLHDLGYGEEIAIMPIVDFNDRKVFDYGQLEKISSIFRE